MNGRRHRDWCKHLFWTYSEGSSRALVRSAHAQKAMFEIGNFLIALAGRPRVDHGDRQGLPRQSSSSDDWDVADALGIFAVRCWCCWSRQSPVAMPAVFSITMALGALALSKEKGDCLQALGDRGNGRR